MSDIETEKPEMTAVLDESAEIAAAGEKMTPKEMLRSMDDARASIARIVAKNLAQSIDENEMVLEQMPDSVERANGETLNRAAKELHDSLLLMAKKLERPLIMRPRRSMKVVR